MGRSHRILIVEDEPNVRLVIRASLTSNDYVLSTAEDGESALRWQENDPADLVLLDLNLPGIGGLEVLRRLRERGDDVPVVIASAHDEAANVLKALRLGAADFLSKPLTPGALRRIVTEVLDRHDRREEPSLSGGGPQPPGLGPALRPGDLH